jgi:uncharacterized protein (TIGR02679 family)
MPGASHEERREVANLLGLDTLPGRELAVPLARLDRALRESRFAVGLPEALELLGGPLRDRPAEREAERRRRETLWEEIASHPLLDSGRVGDPVARALRDWLDELRSTGLLRRLAGERSERELLGAAMRVLEALPRLGEPRELAPSTLRRGVLAASTLGSSHALDPGSPVATLVLRALSRLSRSDRPTDSGALSAAERRELWEGAGVVLDELSSQVLVLGLAPAGPGPVAAALRSLADAGEPARLTLRQLARLTAAQEGVRFGLPPDGAVRVCENPVVVAAAADRLGERCPPLVCPEGVPSLAARDLLAALARRDGRILYHGDFDWPGVRIAGQVLELVSAIGGAGAFEPWRFGAADYHRALDGGAEGPPLGAPGAPTPWDPELARAMADAGRAVEEETVLDELLADLGAGPG